jgi:hypothetical protein
MKSAHAKRSGASFAAAGCASLALTLACGGGGSSGSTPAANGAVGMSISDAATENWATIGVKILGISLTPQGGGSAVPVYTAPTPVPTTNLVQLDNLSEILSIPSVPAETYSGAVITLSGNPGDVSLVVSANPETGFDGTASATIPSNKIQIQGAQGSVGSRIVPVSVKFQAPVTVSANQTTPLDLEFDLSHPAFLVEHFPASSSTPFWAVNFRGPIRHHPIYDVARLLLRHHYGTVTTVSTDASSLTIDKDFPVYPATNPETAITSDRTLPILADATNGTIFYDVDAKTRTVLDNFSSVAASLPGKYLRVAARYQQNGTLVAVRMWASSNFNNVWVSPEGHVLHVDNTTPTAPVITVENENGVPVPITVNTNTQFFFRTPQDALADATPIATGTGFVTSNNLVRGFKIHASVVDPLASPLVAQTVDIEIAKYDGSITSSNASHFTYNRVFETPTDGYTKTLAYIASTTTNGKDASGNMLEGFKWWNFTYPNLADTNLNTVINPITDFVNATDGSVTFGNGPLAPCGVSYCTWNDPAAANAWAARWTVLMPTQLPIGTVKTTWVANASGGRFGMVEPAPFGDNSTSVTVNLSDAANFATLVYQVDDTNGIVTVSPQDLTTSSGLSATAAALGSTTTQVKVFGIPQAGDAIKCYVLFYYTGTASTK